MQQGDEARRRFAAWLQEVHKAAGTPSANKVAKASAALAERHGRRQLSSSGVDRLLRAEFIRPPDWESVTAFLEACAKCAPSTRPVPKALLDSDLWERRYEQLVSLVEAAKEHHRDQDKRDAPDVAQALATYARRVRESYGRLDLEVLTPDTDQGVQPVVELREVFTAPTVRADPPPVELSRELMLKLIEGRELLTEGDLPPGLDLELLEYLTEAYRRQPAEPVLNVLAQGNRPHVVLLGDPGAGKSTLAHYLALTLTNSPGCAGPLADLAGCVPLVVELRHYAQPAWRQKTFEEFLEHLWANEGMALPKRILQRLLEDGRVILVFDGLDEIFEPEFRAETTRRIAGFAARHQCRVIVTSRVIGYQRQTLDGAGFAHYMIQDLDTPRIHAFAQRWYETACPDQPALVDQLVTRLKAAVAHSRSVRELAGNPLLLTILAILGRRQTLPRDRHSVYQHAVTVLVARWDRDAKHLSTHLSGPVADALDLLGQVERLEMLRLLARRMQEGHGGISGNYIPERDIEDVFRHYLELCDIPGDVARRAARAMVSQLRERNFILARYGGGAWGFVHRTFLEYLAAADIVHRYEHEREWTPDALITEVLVPRAKDTTWHEVILLLAGQLRERDTAALIDSLLKPVPAVEAEHLSQLRHGPTDRNQRLALALRALAEVKKIGVLARQSTAVVDAITQVLSTAPRHLLEQWDFFPVEAVIPALPTFSEHWAGRSRYLAWYHVWGQFLSSSSPTQLACALHKDPCAVIAYARFAWSPPGRAAALTELGERWPDNPVVTEAVVTCAVQDDDVSVRIAGARALSARWAHRKHAVRLEAFLRDRASRDPAPGARKEAMNHLLRHCPTEETRRFLRQRAQLDCFDAVRAAAERLVMLRGGPVPVLVSGTRRRSLLDRAALRQIRGVVEWRADPIDDDDEAEVGSHEAEAIVAEALEQWRRGNFADLVRVLNALHTSQALYARLEDHPEDLRMLMREVPDLTRRRLESDEELRPQLQEIARVTSPSQVQSVLLTVIGPVRHDEVRSFITDCARNLDDGRSRAAALRVLAAKWPGDPALMDFLLDQVAQEPLPDNRLLLLQLLCDGWPNEPAVRDVLLDRAVHDSGPAVRIHAQRWLGQWWPDHAGYDDFVGQVRPAGQLRPDERLVRLQTLAAGNHDAELATRLGQERDEWVLTRMRSVLLLQSHPARAASAVLHTRLLTGLRRLLRSKAETAPREPSGT